MENAQRASSTTSGCSPSCTSVPARRTRVSTPVGAALPAARRCAVLLMLDDLDIHRWRSLPLHSGEKRKKNKKIHELQHRFSYRLFGLPAESNIGGAQADITVTTSYRGRSILGFCLGLPTESNKWYSVVGVSGPILKSTTDITWGPGDRVSHPVTTVRGRPGLWGTPSREGEE